MTNAELLAALNRLDALFSDESKWTKGCNARDAEGLPVMYREARAVSFCIRGGCMRVAEDYFRQMIDAMFSESSAPILHAVTWNDSSSVAFADVKRLIADTRARLEAA